MTTLLLTAIAFAQDPPTAFEARGRLVCLLEEMKEKHRAEVTPIHEHVWGFRLEGKPFDKAQGKLPQDGLRYYTVLRTRGSEALFLDPKFKERELRLAGRVFPGSGVLEVQKYQWYKEGKLFDVYYWCDT